MQSLYRPILLKSWQILKKFKYLWPLGFLAAFLGTTSELKMFSDLTYNINSKAVLWENLKNYFLSPDLLNFVYHFNIAPLVSKLFVIIFFIFFLVIVLLFIWLAVSGQAGLINGVNEADKGSRGSLKSNFKIGSHFFAPVLGLNIIAKIFSFLILILIIIPLIIITTTSARAETAIIFIGFFIFLPLVIIINFVTKYASAFVVLKGQGFKKAFTNGWHLFFNNWIISLELALLLLLINILITIIIAIITLLLISPVFVIFFFAGETFYFYPIVLIIVTLAIFLILLMFAALWSVFQTSAWTLLFLKIDKTKQYSKIERLATNNLNK